MESFELKMPDCPKCSSSNTGIDVLDCSNLVRVPAATAAAMMIGIPLNAISFVCRDCGEEFRDKGTE